MTKTKKTLKNPSSTAKNYHLNRKFNITEAEYKEALEAQGGVCKGCGYFPTGRSLHVDHDHEIAGWKVSSEKRGKLWYAWPDKSLEPPFLLRFEESARTKSEALKKVKRRLLRISVRALLCWQCNSSVKKLRDNYEIAMNLGKALREYAFFLRGTIDSRNGFKL